MKSIEVHLLGSLDGEVAICGSAIIRYPAVGNDNYLDLVDYVGAAAEGTQDDWINQHERYCPCCLALLQAVGPEALADQ